MSLNNTEIKQQRLQNRLTPEVHEFRDQCQTLQMATLNNGLPHVSYSPFAHTNRGYYILVSDIAQHGANLQNDPHISIMMIESEDAAKSIYARRRLSFDAIAEHIHPTSSQWQEGIDALRSRHGDIIENLSQLNDFKLYQLTPQSGRYVKGFGKAFNISGNELLEFTHLTEGHVKQQKLIANN